MIGVRHALQRGRGRATVPVGTALVGTVMAVTALCGTAVFGASLSHLTATPKLYGDPFQLNFNSVDGQVDPGLLRSLERDPAVTGITRGIATEVSIGNVSVGALAGTPIRGGLLFSTVDGHLPRADDEIALGTTTMRQVGAHVGSVVRVTVTTPTGGKRTAAFRVVSRVAFPVLTRGVGPRDRCPVHHGGVRGCGLSRRARAVGVSPALMRTGEGGSWPGRAGPPGAERR